MTAEEIENALNLFKRNNDPLVQKSEGTGLGLPLTNKLVNILGGSFHIDTEKGHGTSVSIKLPGYTARRANESMLTPEK